MATLITLHTKQGDTLIVNPDYIVRAEAGTGATLVTVHCLPFPVFVTETVSEVKSLMEGGE